APQGSWARRCSISSAVRGISDCAEGRTDRDNRICGDNGMTVELPREPIHSPFGGSVAARVLRCPASVGLVAKVPAHLRRLSAFAERGTACHAALVQLIDERENLKSLISKTFNGYTITRDDVELALRPVYAYVDALLDEPEAEFYIEQRVTFPT